MTVNANTQIYDNAIDRAAMIRLYERRVNSKIELVIDGHVVRLDDLIKKSSASPLGQRKLFSDVEGEILSTFREIHNTSKRSLLDLVSDQVSYTYQNIETAVGSIWAAKRPENRVAEDVVLEKPLYNNQRLSAGWGGVANGEKIRLEGVIRKGIAEGQTVDQIALAVRKGNVHTITRQQSKALVITAITSVTAQADHSVYKANEKAIRGWQYVAVLDARTTPVCAHRDGHIYPTSDTEHLPPAHFNCRSTTVPVFKSWSDIADLEGVSAVRRKNMANLSAKEKAFYDGQTPLAESYNDWLLRQPRETQLRHLGDYQKVELFRTGQMPLEKFTNPEGNSIGIRELRALSDSGYTPPNDTVRFANAKAKLDSMQLGVSRPEDLVNNKDTTNTLRDYYLLQAGELDGTLSYTNYRGALIHTKKATRQRVLSTPPHEDQIKFNPVTGKYEDTRMYQPNLGVFSNNMKLLRESPDLTDTDKKYIEGFVESLDGKMGLNERAVVADNMRIMFTRYRKNPEVWVNFKAVSQAQIKFDVMNVSDAIETQIRKDSDVLKKLLQDNYIDPVLGTSQLQDLHDNFIKNVIAKNTWEDKVAPKIAKELKGIFDVTIAKNSPVVWKRISDRSLQQFYLKFANRLSLADSPDRDQLAVSLGRDLYNLANLNGGRNAWYKLGMSILETPNVSKFYEIETFGVQKRRMKSRLGGSYFGPYYDTMAFNVRVTDPRIQQYAQLTRKVEVGLRVGVTEPKNQLIFREGYKTYFVDRGILGLYDTRIPITSTNSFSDFPEEFIDKDMVKALNWASKTKYKIDNDFYDFIDKLLYFEDDKGKAKFYNERNEYRKYIASRGDAYERFKSMQWLRSKEAAFSNHAFVDHRARIYDRGLISPQSGETFRPFLNTSESKAFSKEEFDDLQDQIGSFLGGLSDKLEGRYNSLSITGRQKIAATLRPELVKIGNHMLKAKPNDIRAVLESDLVSQIDGEELGKFFRFAIESAKIDNFLKGDYSLASRNRLKDYQISVALEQDASSSGAQIIALTTRNKQLAELSNVVPTNQKRRLYDEIAAATFNDPEFRKLNEKLGLTEKDLRKAAKAQNMVTFYGAGERTGILNVEGKLSKILGKDTNTLVVKAADRDTVLEQISARMARYEKFDPETTEELRALRNNVKDIFNKGLDPGDDILEQLYFLDSKTRDLVTKMSSSYERVVTPDDFKAIAKIMSAQLAEQVPILKDFTKFFGRLAEDYLVNAKPSNSDFDWKSVLKTAVFGSKKKGYVLPDALSTALGIKPGKAVSQEFLEKFGSWVPNGTLKDIIYGVDAPEARRTGGKYFKTEVIVPTIDLKNAALGKDVKLSGIELFYANKLPKSWTNVPWVNFDGKIIEQNFTQAFEEKLRYQDKDGNWFTSILQVSQKTEASWWDQVINKSGKINDIADATRARTAFAVNGNHSNDAVIVKKFHLWGADNNIQTSTIHDAFFANAADMLKARKALRKIYAETLKNNVIRMTLEEMRARGLPDDLYKKYLDEAIESGLIPVVGRSRINGRLMTEKDILSVSDILQEIPEGFKKDYGWYGVG
jgi:SPP1 gp7 family putative phage head morphogenesis protein